MRKIWKHTGLSQAALGTDLGVSRPTINAIEIGRYDPSLPFALALTLALAFARIFERTVDAISDRANVSSRTFFNYFASKKMPHSASTPAA